MTLSYSTLLFPKKKIYGSVCNRTFPLSCETGMENSVKGSIERLIRDAAPHVIFGSTNFGIAVCLYVLSFSMWYRYKIDQNNYLVL